MDLGLFQFLICSYLIGLIWTIQLVHYPSFHYIDRDQFAHFSRFHQKKITFIVAPAMVVELLLSIVLTLKYGRWENYLLLILLILIWLITFFMMVPMHQKLVNKKDTVIISKLIRWNWSRTILWSFRGVILLFLLNSKLI